MKLKQFIIPILAGLLIASSVGAITLLAPWQGGTGLGSYSAGDIIIATSTNTLYALPKGSDGQVLKLTSGIPAWGTDEGGAGGSQTPWTSNIDGATYNLTNVGNLEVDGTAFTLGVDGITGNRTQTIWAENGYEANLKFMETPVYGMGIRYNAQENILYWDRYFNSATPSGSNMAYRSDGTTIFEGNTLVVDVPDSRVGINDTTPDYTLDVNGTLRATGASTLGGTLNMSNNIITNIGDAGTDFTSSGGLTLAGANDITMADDSNDIGLTVIQNDVTNAVEAARITQASDENALVLDCNGNSGASTSVGGCQLIDNTGNTGAGIVVYSNMNGNSNGHLISARADNALFDQSAIYATYDGVSHLATFINRGNGGANAALNLTSDNPDYSTLTITGEELTHGTIKVSHTGTGTDGGSAALSLDLIGSGTAAQGIYINSSVAGGTTGDLVFIQNNTTPRFKIEADGHTILYDDLTVGDDLFVDNSTGEVGIGIADPLARLHVNYPTAGNVIFQAGTGDGSSDMDLKFGYNEYGWYWRYLGSGSGDNNELQLWSEGQGGVDDQVYGIKQSGNITFKQDVAIDGTLTLTTPLDISANTNLTAGRSLTMSGDSVVADEELYHQEKCFYIEDPVDSDDLKSLFHFRKAATITSMWCESDQTVNMDLQLDDGTPSDINGTDLVCDSTPADDTSLGGDTGAGAGERLDLVITSVSGTPTWLSVCFDYTYND